MKSLRGWAPNSSTPSTINPHESTTTSCQPRAAPAGVSRLPAEFDRDARPVPAARDGYVQIVDLDALVNLAAQEDVILRLERRPGQYAIQGLPLATMAPGDRLSDQLAAKINAAIVLGSRRTPTQDIEFAVHQLVEIAVRALSPGINDPFTAIACIDRLGSGLCHLARRELPGAAALRQAGSPAPAGAGAVVCRCRRRRVQPDQAVRTHQRRGGHSHAGIDRGHGRSDHGRGRPRRVAAPRRDDRARRARGRSGSR